MDQHNKIVLMNPDLDMRPVQAKYRSAVSVKGVKFHSPLQLALRLQKFRIWFCPHEPKPIDRYNIFLLYNIHTLYVEEAFKKEKSHLTSFGGLSTLYVDVAKVVLRERGLRGFVTEPR